MGERGVPARIIGPYGEKPIEMKGFDVSIRRAGDRVHVVTKEAAADFVCGSAIGDQGTPQTLRATRVPGNPAVFSE